VSRLRLGPIIGHTDDTSTAVWIRVHDNPEDYELRIRRRGTFPFLSTETQADQLEFGTAVAFGDALRPEWEYDYDVLRRGRVIPGTEGTFRTMPVPGSYAEGLFVSVSCSHGKDLGAWPLLASYIKEAKPRFLIMMGDQVYLDSGDEIAANVWERHFDSQSALRRQAIADKYQEHWSREPIRTILANIPTYMMWDDHDIRNGWGSLAPDSPTLAARYNRGKKIAASYNAYFEDARDLFWHFQACRNPRPPASLAFPSAGTRKGIPFFFRCGRLAVIVLDARGDRDVWRATHPVLGNDQWAFLNKVFGALPADVDALCLVVPLPLTSMSPTGITQTTLGNRTDDIEMFEKGDAKGLMELAMMGGRKGFFSRLTANRWRAGPPIFGDIGNTQLDTLTDVRDCWANHFCRAEQSELIRTAGRARLTNRLASQPRSLMFIGGDLHAGGLFTVSASNPDFVAPSLVSSGISKQSLSAPVGILMDEDFEITNGIHAKLQKYTSAFNFGVTHVFFGGGSALFRNAVAHDGENTFWSLKLPAEGL
jgi:hypothetical protein